VYETLLSSKSVEEFHKECLPFVDTSPHSNLNSTKLIKKNIRINNCKLKKENPVDQELLAKAEIYLKGYDKFSWGL
jgi:hypothetical protein